MARVLGLDLGDAQLLDRYSRWRSVDTLAVAMATDSLNRIYAVPGRTASAVRRFGMGLIQRAKPVKNFFMSEARGESGALPKLLDRRNGLDGLAAFLSLILGYRNQPDFDPPVGAAAFFGCV